MGKLRSVDTSFWSDPFIEDLTVDQKLIYLYLITNEKTNMLGVYEVSLKKMSFDTGVKIETVSKALEQFQKNGKIRYENNFLILLKFLKHQNYNPNMMKSAIDVFNGLPEFIRGKNVTLCKIDTLKSFETLSNRLGMVRKVEVELEDETKTEIETEDEEEKPLQEIKISLDYNLILDYVNKKFNRNSKVVSTKVQSAFNARKKDGYKLEDILTAIDNAYLNDFHRGNNYQYCTLEFFSRSETIDKYSVKPIQNGNKSNNTLRTPEQEKADFFAKRYGLNNQTGTSTSTDNQDFTSFTDVH